jgi:hypothetical protein
MRRQGGIQREIRHHVTVDEDEIAIHDAALVEVSEEVAYRPRIGYSYELEGGEGALDRHGRPS